MKWTKKGLIYAPDGKSDWAKHSALQPTPYILSNSLIRIYTGFRDRDGVSRIGFVDVDLDDPSKVRNVSNTPVLDIGLPGTFDDNGVVPAAIVRRGRAVYLYYAGYHLEHKIRFTVFGGLAISDDGGDSFYRHSKVPILDRTDKELFFRVIHSILFEDGVWKIWYGAGSEWIAGPKKQLPVYDIRYSESTDGITFGDEGRICIKMEGDDEHRVSRPYVVKDDATYKMYYGVGTISKLYRLGYAESSDGINWERKDDEIGIDVSSSGWDSEMIAYPSVIRHEKRTYLFYNGNNMGETGLGYALLRHG
jgi:predicted GH43/DUF377 family glycosyl hydrolase